MHRFSLTVEDYLSGIRVDSFLSRHFRNYTSWRLHRLVRTGAVEVDGVQAAADQRVHRGQIVSGQLLEPPDKLLAGSTADIRIVYEDPWLIVIDKPVGLVAHPVGEFQDDTLSNAVQTHLDQQTAVKGLLRAGIVHRLDRMTSGLLVVVKDHLSHRRLSIDFQQGKPSKTYVALVEGHPDFAQRMIDLSIGRRAGSNSILMSAGSDALRARAARTDVVVLRSFAESALVECRLHTGRNHQIRVHLAAIGHPVLGDEYYAAHGQLRKLSRAAGQSPTQQRHALHASRLEFQHPILRVPLSFTSQPPSDFWQLADLSPARQKHSADADVESNL